MQNAAPNHAETIQTVISVLAFLIPIAASFIGLKVLNSTATLKNELQAEATKNSQLMQTTLTAVQLEMGKMELRLVQQINTQVAGVTKSDANIEAIFDRLDKIDVRFGTVEQKLEGLQANRTNLATLFSHLEDIEASLDRPAKHPQLRRGPQL